MVRAALPVTFVLSMAGGESFRPRPAVAQYTESAYFQAWTDLATIYNLGERWRYDGDYGLRAAVSTGDFTQIFLRPKVRFEAASWLRLHAGVGWFHTFFRDASDADEIRPWVGVRIVGPRPGGFVIQNYFRLETRFFEFGRGVERAVWRGRWQLQARSPDFRIGSAERFYAVAFSEVFNTFDGDVEGFSVERLRLNAGLGRTFSSTWRAELNGLFQSGRVEEGLTGFDLDDIILRLRMFYTFN